MFDALSHLSHLPLSLSRARATLDLLITAPASMNEQAIKPAKEARVSHGTPINTSRPATCLLTGTHGLSLFGCGVGLQDPPIAGLECHAQALQ